MEEALHLHRQGRLRDAFERYKAILAEHPDHAPALHYLGRRAAASPATPGGAVDLIRQAIPIDQAPAEPWANLAQALAAIGRPEAAVNALKEAARRSPQQADDLEQPRGRRAGARSVTRDAEALGAQGGRGRCPPCAGVVQPGAGAGAAGPDPRGAGRRVARGGDRPRRHRARGPRGAAAGRPRPLRRRAQDARRRAGPAPDRRGAAQPAGARRWSGWAICPAAARALETVLRLEPDDGAALSQLALPAQAARRLARPRGAAGALSRRRRRRTAVAVAVLAAERPVDAGRAARRRRALERAVRRRSAERDAAPATISAGAPAHRLPVERLLRAPDRGADRRPVRAPRPHAASRSSATRRARTTAARCARASWRRSTASSMRATWPPAELARADPRRRASTSWSISRATPRARRRRRSRCARRRSRCITSGIPGRWARRSSTT